MQMNHIMDCVRQRTGPCMHLTIIPNEWTITESNTYEQW